MCTLNQETRCCLHVQPLVGETNLSVSLTRVIVLPLCRPAAQPCPTAQSGKAELWAKLKATQEAALSLGKPEPLSRMEEGYLRAVKWV